MRRHFPPDSSWPHNTIAGERVSPDRDFLIAQLATIANPQTERELIVDIPEKFNSPSTCCERSANTQSGVESCMPTYQAATMLSGRRSSLDGSGTPRASLTRPET